MRRHEPTNTAQITVGGKVHSLGRWGSPEAKDRFDTTLAAFLPSGRQNLDAGLAVVGRAQAAVGSRLSAPSRPMPDATGGLTVGELARAWLADIEATRPDHKST